MKNKGLIGCLLCLVIVFFTIPLTASADSPISSGTGISTGYTDWQVAVNDVGTGIEANYLQVEASWYNEAYDIYRAYLNFNIPQNVTHATLTIYPTGVIYNQDGIKLIVVDSGLRIGEIELSNLNIRTKSTIELSGVITGSIVLMTSNEWYNTPPLRWNWITLDNNTEKPCLTYDSNVAPNVVSEPQEISSSAISGYVILGIAIVIIIGFLIWRFAR